MQFDSLLPYRKLPLNYKFHPSSDHHNGSKTVTVFRSPEKPLISFPAPSWPERTEAGSSFTVVPLQRRRSIGLPHHWVPLAHRPAAALLLRHVPVDVAHTHPAAPRAGGAGRAGADGPLGVVLAVFEGKRLARLDVVDVLDLPISGAVGRQDARGQLPELDQEVGLKGRSHPGVVEVCRRRRGRVNENLPTLNPV